MSEVKVNKISPRTNCGTVTVGDSGDSVSVTAGVPVTVNGDLKSNALKATDGGSIISQCGTTITLGASGDTVSLASGASQSGFGRAGSVDWQTGDIKTATFTAADGEGYFCNTTSSAFTVNLPAGSSGAIVAINDYAQTAATNNITVAANGSEKIEGSTENHLIVTNGVTATLVYVDSTRGWKVVDTGESSNLPEVALFTTATGGTITTSGDYKIHTFTGPGTFCVSQIGNAPTNPSGGPNTVSYMVLAGGGSGAGSETGGGGGAGGFREGRDITPSYTASPLVAPAGLTITASPFPITVGGGGSAGPSNGNPGSNSIFSTITSTGGGGGANHSPSPGGSGGGGGRHGSNGSNGSAGGLGNTPPVSPPQGNPGGNRFPYPAPGGSPNTGGGGGGATANGANGSSCGGPGGNGATTSISASPTTYAGGGGGGAEFSNAGSGGSGGGAPGIGSGPGGAGDGSNAPGASANTGGGGGGTGWGPTAPHGNGGAGGSGIVIIRYKFQ
jgi:hypothetical protein